MEPKYKEHEKVEVNLTSSEDNPRWTHAEILSISMNSLRGIPFTQPIYNTTQGIYLEKYVRAILEA